MTNTPPTPEKPSPEALAAARTVLPEGMTLIAVLERKLREDFALALDRFAAARVEAERERCAAIFAHYQSPRATGRKISDASRKILEETTKRFGPALQRLADGPPTSREPLPVPGQPDYVRLPAAPQPPADLVERARLVYQTIEAFGWQIQWRHDKPVPYDAWPRDIIERALAAERAEATRITTEACEEANRLHNGLTGKIKMDADARAEWVLHQYLDGLTIRKENREGIKEYLTGHFARAEADARAQGVREGIEMAVNLIRDPNGVIYDAALSVGDLSLALDIADYIDRTLPAPEPRIEGTEG